MVEVLAHTMEYCGGSVDSSALLARYTDDYFEQYKSVYEACFHEMRAELGLKPVDACDSREELLNKSNDIFLYTENNILIGSIAIYKNEIDDLIVVREYQHKGYGRLLLNFAIATMQKKCVSPIVLHVADWNKQAVNLYLKNGFVVTKTEIVNVSD